MKCSTWRGAKILLALQDLPSEIKGDRLNELSEAELLRIHSRLERAQRGGQNMPLGLLVQQSEYRRRSAGKR